MGNLLQIDTSNSIIDKSDNTNSYHILLVWNHRMKADFQGDIDDDPGLQKLRRTQLRLRTPTCSIILTFHIRFTEISR